jgi:hypothetical protein
MTTVSSILLRLRKQCLVLSLLGAVLSMGCRAKQPQVPPIDPNKLVIEKATWSGADGRTTLDVTKVVAGLVHDNALTLSVTAQVLGEPAAFMIKELRLHWSKGGVVGRKVAVEGKTLTIAADEKPVPTRIVVRSAVYGRLEHGETVDVTWKVDSLLNDKNVLSFTPTDLLFGDPAAGLPKQLRVDYTLDGVAKSKIGNEGLPFTLSAANP